MGDAQDPVRAVARGLDRTARRVGELDELLQQLAKDVAALVAQPGAGGQPPTPIASWLLADDPATALPRLLDLAAWVGRVYLRYADALVPSCWLWHPDIVEELTWLRGAHAEAYPPHGAISWSKAADWHDRQRPGVVGRLKVATGCDLSRHHDGDLTGQLPIVPLLDAATDITNSWTTTSRTPNPTPQQLHEAEQHDQSLPRTRTA